VWKIEILFLGCPARKLVTILTEVTEVTNAVEQQTDKLNTVREKRTVRAFDWRKGTRDRQRTYNIPLRRVRVTIVAVEKQYYVL